MNFWDIACIVFVCTAANHLGLVQAVETIIKHKLPVVGCVKCLSFWSVLAYCLVCCDSIATYRTSITAFAISFLSAWASIWLDLIMGMIDQLYLKIYDTLYSATDEADTDAFSATDTVPDVPGSEEGNCDNGAAKKT